MVSTRNLSPVWDPWGSGYGRSYQLLYSTANDWKLTFRNTGTLLDEAGEDVKTPRNYYQFLLVYPDDEMDVQQVIAESEQVARDIIVQERLKDGARAKDVEIKVVQTIGLKPKAD